MRIGRLLEKFGQTMNLIESSREFERHLEDDREVMMEALREMVSNMTSAQFDEMDSYFLRQSLVMLDVKHRVRAMEMYAWLKILELERFGEFRGFKTASQFASL